MTTTCRATSEKVICTSCTVEHHYEGQVGGGSFVPFICRERGSVFSEVAIITLGSNLSFVQRLSFSQR